MEDIYLSKVYKRSRKGYFAQCAIEYLASIAASGTFLAKLLSSMGFSDALTGIISSLAALSCLVQLLSLRLVNKTKNIKRTVIAYDMLSFILFMLAYLLPFFKEKGQLRTILMFVFIGGGNMFKALISSMHVGWGYRFVNPSKRGDFQSTNEMISLVAGSVFTLGMGVLIDRFEANGNLYGGFLLCSMTILTLSVMNFIAFSAIEKVPTEEEQKQKKSLREIINATFGNKGFCIALAVQILYCIAQYFVTGFLGTFELRELSFSVGAIQLIQTLGLLAWFILSKPIGRYSDEIGFVNGYTLGLIVAAAAYFCLIFTGPATRYLIFVYLILYNASMSGISGNTTNMLFNYVRPDCFMQALALRSAITGVIGFLASIAAGKVLDYVQAAGNTVFGIAAYGQNVLAAVSFTLTFICIVLSKTVLKRQQRVRP